MSTREVMQLALDALEMQIHGAGSIIHSKMAWDALKAELAKPEPEPVGWANSAHNFSGKYSTFIVAYHKSTGWDVPLYRKEGVE